jgi:ABC-2 type transport system ATP-binding protein
LLSEIEVTCDRVAFIRHGEVVRLLELASLDQNLSIVTIRASGMDAETIEGLARWGTDIRADGDHVTMTIRGEDDLPQVARYLVERGAAVYALTPNRVPLEEIFIETIGEDGGL